MLLIKMLLGLSSHTAAVSLVESHVFAVVVSSSEDSFANTWRDMKACAYQFNVFAPEHYSPFTLESKDANERANLILVVPCWLMTVIRWVIFELYFFLKKFYSEAWTTLDNHVNQKLIVMWLLSHPNLYTDMKSIAPPLIPSQSKLDVDTSFPNIEITKVGIAIGEKQHFVLLVGLFILPALWLDELNLPLRTQGRGQVAFTEALKAGACTRARLRVAEGAEPLCPQTPPPKIIPPP